jgi:hypothetical protein
MEDTIGVAPIGDDMAKLKAKVKNELTVMEREIQHQKWQAYRLAQPERKTEALAAAEEK